MTVEVHPSTHWPDDPDATVWRYLDLPKYLSMLESNSLYFCRLDQLDDPFEGSRPRTISGDQEALMNQVLVGMSEEGVEANVEHLAQLQSRVTAATTKWFFVNCWHLGEYESAAMWRLYMPPGAGVAIRSTFDRLKASLDGSDTRVYLGQVAYIDHSTDHIPPLDSFTPAVCKSRSYEYESELRALVYQPVTGPAGDPFNPAASALDVGVQVDVDLETLVAKVHVSPDAPSWFGDLVAAVTARYGFGWDLTQSALLEDPFF